MTVFALLQTTYQEFKGTPFLKLKYKQVLDRLYTVDNYTWGKTLASHSATSERYAKTHGFVFE